MKLPGYSNNVDDWCSGLLLPLIHAKCMLATFTRNKKYLQTGALTEHQFTSSDGIVIYGPWSQTSREPTSILLSQKSRSLTSISAYYKQLKVRPRSSL